MILSTILAVEMLRQVGTGALVPRAPRIENRPQFVPRTGFVGEPKGKRVPLEKIIRMPCTSTECRLFCHPENMMRPGWCHYYLEPEDGYLTLEVRQ